MIKNKKAILGYGLMGSLIIGLTGCQMMSGASDEMTYKAPEEAQVSTVTTNTTKPTVKADTQQKGPVQKSTPGPKRAAAPQLPVIE